MQVQKTQLFSDLRPSVFIAGQKGSGCSEVARILARKLSPEFEVLDYSQLVRKAVSDTGLSFSQFFATKRDFTDDLQKAAYQHADYNAVVEGKSAFIGLDAPAFKVLLKSSLEARARHVSEVYEVRLDEALVMIKKSDEKRQRLVKKLHGHNWLDSSLYNLVIDTTGLNPEEVADIIYRCYLSAFD